MGKGGGSVNMALRPGSEDFADMWVSRGGLEARRHGEQASQVTKWRTDSVRRVTMGVHNLGARCMGPQEGTVHSCIGRSPRAPGNRDWAHLAQERTVSGAYTNVLDALLQTIIPEAIVNPEANQLQGWLGPKHVLSRHV